MRTLAALLVILMIWSAGLLAFAGRVDRSTPAPDPPVADGVVALTGGSTERLTAALGLLEAGKAKRLLISGVSRQVTRSELQTLMGVDKPIFDCCVDLGFTAANTLGNGRESADWARSNGYKTLILVTADYHMPRARLELKSAAPDVTVIPYPVATGEMHAGAWWKTGAEAQRMIVEYCKYLAVLARESVLGLGHKHAAAGTRPA